MKAVVFYQPTFRQHFELSYLCFRYKARQHRVGGYHWRVAQRVGWSVSRQVAVRSFRRAPSVRSRAPKRKRAFPTGLSWPCYRLRLTQLRHRLPLGRHHHILKLLLSKASRIHQLDSATAFYEDSFFIFFCDFLAFLSTFLGTKFNR